MGNSNSSSPPPPVASTTRSGGSSPAHSGAAKPNLEKDSSGADSREPGYYIQPLKDEEHRDSNRPSLKRHNRHRRPGSGISQFSSEGSGESVPIPSLHGSLLHVHPNRDPLRYYEILKVLGDGSMGSVSKVQKRKSAKGGSARKHFVEREKRHRWCWGLLDPEHCGFNFCLPKNEDEIRSFSSDHLLVQPFNSSTSTDIFGSVENSETSAEGGNHHKKTPPSRDARVKVFASAKSSSMITYESKDVVYALKSIHLDRCKDRVFRQELMNEIAILQRLDHPHIVKAMETFDYKDRLYLVLELCSGGDLYTRDPYTEDQACTIVHAVLDAVAYMHARGITHRDLKFENIMFSTPSCDSVKVIDFGLSKKYSHDEHLTETVGTVYTMAPEVLRGDYDHKCDVWSMGVIAFMLLSSSLPFYGKTRPQVVRKVLSGRYGFKGHRWKLISNEAKEFVMECLVPKPSRRKPSEAMLKHPFILNDFTANQQRQIGFVLMDRVLASIQTFCGYEQIKKLGLLVIAHKSTEEEIGFLRHVFDRFDITRDGEIVLSEFKEALKVYHYDDEDLERMFIGMDLDGTGKVHYSEFLAATLEAHGKISEERLAEAFDRLDNDDTGFITKQNILDFLGNSVSDEYANAIIDEADIERDHRISYDEFLALWNAANDEKLQHAFVDVNFRRESYDDTSSLGESIGSLKTETSSDDLSVDRESAAESTELRGGTFFFGIEKEKSVRGVWL